VIRTIRAELFKFRTTPGPWVVLVVTLALTALSILTAFAAAAAPGHSFGTPTSGQQLRDLMGSGYFAALLMAPIMGVLCITTEYRHQVITTTLLVTPRRVHVVVAKALASVLWGLLLCIASLVMVAAMGIPWLAAMGGSTSALTHQIGPVVPGLFGDYALLALFGLGVGVLVRNQIAGVLLTLVLSLILEPILVAIAVHILHYNLNWLPSDSAASLAGGLSRAIGGGQGGRGTAGITLLEWWSGGLVLLAWGALPAVLGYFTSFRRDVT
jgi:ABC-2 type transport system permease protein